MDSRGDGLEQLVDEMDGVFVVTTTDGVAYLLNMDERLITTRRERTASAPESAPVRMLTLVACSVGEPMVALLDRGVAGVWFTRRVTASVTRIEPVDARSALPRRAAR